MSKSPAISMSPFWDWQRDPGRPSIRGGYWLYAGGVPIVHLVQKRPGEARLGPGTGELDHVALEGKSIWMRTRQILAVARGYAFLESVVPRDGVTQNCSSPTPMASPWNWNFAPLIPRGAVPRGTSRRKVPTSTPYFRMVVLSLWLGVFYAPILNRYPA